MKRIGRYFFLSLVFSLFAIFAANKVMADSFDFYGTIENYNITEEDTGTPRVFSSDKYNFSFPYAYRISSQGYGSITNAGIVINDFFGVKTDTTISYENIPNTSTFVTVDDSFVLYKYNHVGNEFIEVYNPGQNKTGNYTITELGLYRLRTFVGNNKRDRYIIYENKFYSMNINRIETDVVNDKLYIYLDVKSPFLVASPCSASLKIADQSVTNSDTCQVNQNGSAGNYRYILTQNVGETVLKDADIMIQIQNTSVNASEYLSYDFKSPVIVDNKVAYYNSLLLNSEFKKEYDSTSQDIEVANSNLVVQFEISDDSEIESIKVSDIACSLENNNVVTCELTVKNIVDSNRELSYEIKDEYGNTLSFTHTVVATSSLLTDDESFDDYAEFVEDENKVAALFDSTSKVKRLCIFYGDDLTNESECNSGNVIASYYYKGNIQIVLMDNYYNIATKTIENVTLTNGYVADDSNYELIYDNNEFLNNTLANSTLKNKILELKGYACGSNASCLTNDKNVLYAKYGELEENITAEETLPPYIEILNKKFKDSSCSMGTCNKEVEVYYLYNVGGKEQKISLNISYIDQLPYITNSFEIESVALEYKGFNITDQAVIESLFGDEQSVLLTGSIVGRIRPRFIKYTSREGNETVLNNEAYTYIGSTDNFGYYLLECRIEVQNGELSGTDVKSFFVDVELKDSTLPVLALVGETEVVVKQNDVFKDSGYKCSDYSGCTVIVTYALNNEENIVENVDTKVPGKYIVKYTATDGDGNIVNATRIVYVESVNNADPGAIVIIVLVAAAFVTALTIAIILEVKRVKKKRESGLEE